MNNMEEKKVQIEPLPIIESDKVPPKRKPGRPRTKPERIERHAATEGRLKALEKARVMKRIKAEERKKAAELEQKKLTAQATQNQGYAYGPQPDMDSSLAKSNPSFYQGKSQQQPYYPPNSMGIAEYERLGRVEQLLSQLVNSYPSPQAAELPQNRIPSEVSSLEHNKSSVFNSNPFLSRRYSQK